MMHVFDGHNDVLGRLWCGSADPIADFNRPSSLSSPFSYKSVAESTFAPLEIRWCNMADSVEEDLLSCRYIYV